MSSAAVLMPFNEWMWAFTGGRSRDFGDACGQCALQADCSGLERDASGNLVFEAQVEPVSGEAL